MVKGRAGQGREGQGRAFYRFSLRHVRFTLHYVSPLFRYVRFSLNYVSSSFR